MTWNIRGLGSEVKVSAIKRLVFAQNVDMLFLQETKKQSLTEDEIYKLWYHDELDFRVSNAEGKSGALAVVWDKTKFVVRTSMVGSNYIALKGKWVQEDAEAFLVNVYAPCSISDQVNLWKDMESWKQREKGKEWWL
ncbi:hypothetical protein V6N13_096218 [Hibiscus sabdariffa]